MNSQYLINNEKGETSLLGVFLLLVVLSASGLLFNKMIKYNQDISLRLNTYTCFKKSIELIQKSQSEMSRYNKALIVAHGIKAALPNPYILAIIQGLKLLQIKVLVNYRFNITLLSKCSLWNKSKMMKHFPYKSLGYFNISRGPLDQAIPRFKVKPLVIKARKKVMTVFTLTANYQLRPKFRLISTKEKSSLLNQIKAL